MKQKLNTLIRIIIVTCFSSTSISSFASGEEATTANVEELKSDSCNVERCCNVNVCDSINMPVFIIDGVEVQDLGSLQADDIEKVEVIKDQAITKIFSPRLGGVLLITTKSKRFLTPVLENYNRGIENARQNRIPGQLLIRGSVNESGNDSISRNNRCSTPCDSISADSSYTWPYPYQYPYYLNGGGEGLLNDLYTALSKTAPQSQNNIKGRAAISFAISKDGIIDPNSIKLQRNWSLPEDYINAAVEAIKGLGKFEPGKFEGVPKRVTYTVYIKYPIPLDRIKTNIE